MKMYMHYAKDEEIIITRKDGNVVMISEEKYNEMKLLKGTNNSYISETPMEYASIQSDVYKQAQEILTELGTSVDAAFYMFLKQVVLTKGIPFEVKLPEKITSISEEDIIQTRLSLENVLLAWYENGAAGKNVTVKTFESIRKSYPDFLKDFINLGGKTENGITLE